MTTTLRELMDAHLPFVWRTLRRNGVSDADLPDQCQEVFLVVHRKLPEFRGDSALRTWLYGIALRVAAGYRRKPHVTRESVGVESIEHAVEAEQERALDGRRALVTLQTILERIAPEQREVFALYELEQIPMAEIAKLVGRPLRTTYAWYQSARAQVLAAWPEKGGE